MRIRLDRTVCDGFGICAKYAPGYFSLDDWGYASLIGDGTVAESDRDAVMRALMDCPVHAIAEIGERTYPTPALRSPTRTTRPNASKPKRTRRNGDSPAERGAREPF
ncbi:hypothetical protein A9X04_25155 [Mycobacterium sp. E3247]|nr:hypothetical protein A9X04_25155 [Mycobacterium sp. E3247]